MNENGGFLLGFITFHSHVMKALFSTSDLFAEVLKSLLRKSLCRLHLLLTVYRQTPSRFLICTQDFERKHPFRNDVIQLVEAGQRTWQHIKLLDKLSNSGDLKKQISQFCAQ